MTKLIGTLAGPGTIDEDDIKRHEHHKITLNVSNFVATVTIKIEELTNPSSNSTNLDSQDRSFTITENGDTTFVLENQRIDKLRINFVSGDATINAYYKGW